LDNPDGSRTYTLTVSVTDALYQYYVSKDHNLYNYDFSKFVTPYSLQPIADDLWDIYSTEEEFANGVLMILHQIPYVESTPQQYPVETLVENEGDCDLFSITAASIMDAGGLDVVLLLLEEHEHMIVGVHLPTPPEYARSSLYYYTHEGRRYYVAETTGGQWRTGWRVGECSESLQSATAKIIDVRNEEQTAPGQVSSSYHSPEPTTISMALSTNFVMSHSNVEITGSIAPSLSGKNVTLYVSSMGSNVNALTTVETDGGGQYSHIWQNPSWGVYEVRANWAGDEDYNGADSSIYRLVVMPTEFLLMGIAVIVCIVILVVLMRATRKKPEEPQEMVEDWDFFTDTPEGF
jgi:hypothetical protein